MTGDKTKLYPPPPVTLLQQQETSHGARLAKRQEASRGLGQATPEAWLITKKRESVLIDSLFLILVAYVVK